MGGPIVRTGTTPKFWENWDRIFADSDKSSKSGASKRKAKKTQADEKSPTAKRKSKPKAAKKKK